MEEIIIRNEEEAMEFILNSTDASIAACLLCFDKNKVSVNKVVAIATKAVEYIHKMIVDSGFEEDGVNVNSCVSMIIFSSSMKAYLDCIDRVAKDVGVDRDTLINEMKLNELSLLKDRVKL